MADEVVWCAAVEPVAEGKVLAILRTRWVFRFELVQGEALVFLVLLDCGNGRRGRKRWEEESEEFHVGLK